MNVKGVFIYANSVYRRSSQRKLFAIVSDGVRRIWKLGLNTSVRDTFEHSSSSTLGMSHSLLKPSSSTSPNPKKNNEEILPEQKIPIKPVTHYAIL